VATQYLKKYALRVIENGYDICFIRPGEKRPFGKEWESKNHGPKRVAAAIGAGRGHFGIGVKAEHTPGVDIDCYDRDLVDHMVRVTQDLCGETLRRVGLAPKTLLVYRTEKPFTKTQSKVFIDDEGRQVKLEVLGDGQQFVAFHIHPDTEKPYRWLDDRSILDVEWSDLQVMDHDDALEIVAEFERQCRKRGWPEKNTVKRLSDERGRAKGVERRNDAFVSDKAGVDLSPEALIKKLHMVPNAEDYDTWFHVGMALYHQSEGEQWGLDAWHEWSASANNYDMDALDAKWPTFDVEGKKREPITARFIIKQAIAEEDRLASEELDDIRKEIKAAADDREFQLVMNRIKHLPFAPITREGLVLALKDAIKKRTDSIMPVATIRRAIAFENPDHKSKPAWLRNWVYIQQDDTFYNSKTRQTMTTKGFDLTFGRFLLTKKDILEGITVPENSATHVAVHRFQIPSVANRMYAPREPEMFEANRLTFVNSYSDSNVPETPDRLTPKELKVCQRIEAHAAHLCPVERDQKLLLSWLAYIVQTGGKVNWSPVLQGVENDGKSFFGRVMAAVLGGDNFNQINGSDLAEKYTSWAEGSQVCLIEEVRLHGTDRFAVINKLKPYISNDMVSIRRMKTDSYKVINTVNYLLTTNHKDGVPVNDNSTRYFPIFSRWQTKLHLDRFNADNPTYYRKLHEVIEHAGALRRWFLDYELHPEFDPVERARESASLKEMRFLNQTEEEENMAAILDKDEPGVCRELLDSSALADVMAETGLSVPYGLAWKRMLSENGFTYLGAVKHDGKTRKFWSQEPDKFVKNGRIDANAVHDHYDSI
jgi:hypothetical protein